ncbi:MAG TPA: hypothetical protein VH583_04600 [Vicinamibacterales bacterium]|jgi:hypothetical protein
MTKHTLARRRWFGRVSVPSIVGLGIAACVAGQGAATIAAQSQGVCALLTIDEIHAVAPKMEIHDGVAAANSAMELSTCRYTWGDGVKASALVISINPASRVYVGMTPDAIKQRLASSVVPETDDSAVPDVGDAAVFKAFSPYYVSASALLKGRVLQLNLEGDDAREMKGQLLSLLKSAASRM